MKLMHEMAWLVVSLETLCELVALRSKTSGETCELDVHSSKRGIALSSVLSGK